MFRRSAESISLIHEAKARNRNRIDYFQNGNGKRLRLNVRDHEIKAVHSSVDCVLCGNSSGPGVRRGHRTNTKCLTCSLFLCLKVYDGNRINCWNVWHGRDRIEKRVAAKE